MSAAVTIADRLRALAGIRAMNGRHLSPEELDRVVEEERDELLTARGPLYPRHKTRRPFPRHLP